MQAARLAQLTSAFAGKRIAVCGDFFLDRYLWIDPARAEISVETGQTAHQVVSQTSAPGAAGTVAANLAALGALVVCLGVVGDDGDGYTLRSGLHALGVDDSLMITTPDRPTPTYTKPVIRQSDGTVRELERLDIRSRDALPTAYRARFIDHLDTLAHHIDAVVFADQMPETHAGIIDDIVHRAIVRITQEHPLVPMFADSRARIDLFRGVVIKPNLHEALRALGRTEHPDDDLNAIAVALSARTQHPVVMTLAGDGVIVSEHGISHHIPGIPVDCPIDVVGAGDSVMAALAIARAAGATLVEAAEIAMYVAAVTIRKLGTTGTATPAELTTIARHYGRLDL
jgi:rfaE bifunctional protein kinase chain/domain